MYVLAFARTLLENKIKPLTKRNFWKSLGLEYNLVNVIIRGFRN